MRPVNNPVLNAKAPSDALVELYEVTFRQVPKYSSRSDGCFPESSNFRTVRLLPVVKQVFSDTGGNGPRMKIPDQRILYGKSCRIGSVVTNLAWTISDTDKTLPSAAPSQTYLDLSRLIAEQRPEFHRLGIELFHHVLEPVLLAWFPCDANFTQ